MNIGVNLSITGTIVLNQAEPFTNPELWPQPEFADDEGLTLTATATVDGQNLVFDGSESPASCTATGVSSIADAVYEYAVSVASHGGLNDLQLVIGGTGVTLDSAGPFSGEVTAANTSGFLLKDDTNRTVAEIASTSINRKALPLNVLTLNGNVINENSPEDTVVAAFTNTLPGSTLAITDSAGNRFKLSGNNVVCGPVATDYETATSHNITVRETLAEAPNSPRDTVLTITVVNVGD